jgi:hypothetical protein
MTAIRIAGRYSDDREAGYSHADCLRAGRHICFRYARPATRSGSNDLAREGRGPLGSQGHSARPGSPVIPSPQDRRD